jgi:hypothetical protein
MKSPRFYGRNGTLFELFPSVTMLVPEKRSEPMKKMIMMMTQPGSADR